MANSLLRASYNNMNFQTALEIMYPTKYAQNPATELLTFECTRVSSDGKDYGNVEVEFSVEQTSEGPEITILNAKDINNSVIDWTLVESDALDAIEERLESRRQYFLER